MKFGTLHITMPDGKTREYPLDQPSISIGRAPGNELLIEETSISRRHARLSVESGRLMIEDSGSANGTFIGSQRLEPNTPSLVSEDQIVHLGDVEVKYTAPPPLQPSTPDATASISPAAEAAPPAAGSIAASLVGPNEAATPGSVTTALLTVQNRGSVVDELKIHVAGIPAEWVKLSKDRVPLLPGAQDQIVITFMPPRRPDAVAGYRVFSVVVNSRQYRTTEQVHGTLQVQSFGGFSLNIQPVRARRNFQLIAHNLGNTAATYRFSGMDDEALMGFDFRLEQIALQPGQRLIIPLRVKSRIKPLAGLIETRGFTITASTPDDSGPEVKTTGQLIIQRGRRWWLWAIVLILLIALAGGAVYLLNGNPPQVCHFFPTLAICPQIY
jgi:hypothetical protein